VLQTANKVEALRVHIYYGLMLVNLNGFYSKFFDWMYQFSASDVMKTSFSRQQMNFTAAFLES
jgi:hypothetical protein